jgi:hypothetical protein
MNKKQLIRNQLLDNYHSRITAVSIHEENAFALFNSWYPSLIQRVTACFSVQGMLIAALSQN